MRQLRIQVPTEKVERVLDLAREHDVFAPVAVDIDDDNRDGRRWSLLLGDFPNQRVGSFVWAVRDEVEEAKFTLLTSGVLSLEMPLDRVQNPTRQVTHLSTLELVIASLQSIGSWQGMLLYAAYSGVIAAYGVIFNSSFLLVAAMLIAPMGAPAMVSVIGTAVGDWRMVGRGLLRFVASIAMLVLSAMLLGFGYGLNFSTALMEEVTALSQWGVLVALVAGAAGAQAQVESSRSSLVTGTATGFLIAAALSPTSAVLGLSLVLKRWDYATLTGFQLALQYGAVVTGGWLSLRKFGVVPSDPSTGRGSDRWRAVIAAVLLVAVVGLSVWQARQGTTYRKADLSVEAIELTRDALRQVPDARLLEANAHFTRPDISTYSRESMLVDVVVESLPGSRPLEDLSTAVREAVSREVRARLSGVIPFVTVTVIPGPGTGASP